MNARRDPDRLIHAFLLEGEEELQDQVYDAVRADIEQKRQRVVIGPWRTPIMNRIVGFGLAAAAVVAAVLIGSQLLGSPPAAAGGPADHASPEPTATPEPTPTPSAAGLPEARSSSPNTDDPVQTTVNIASSGWFALPGLDAIRKNDDGLDPPETVGAALLAWAWPAGTGFYVYGDPCQWSTTIPETPATTPDEIAAAFAAQASTERRRRWTSPWAGSPARRSRSTCRCRSTCRTRPGRKSSPTATTTSSASTASMGRPKTARNAQGAGQIDELWILDVDGSIVILDATYSPATPADLVEEMRTIAESATFDGRSLGLASEPRRSATTSCLHEARLNARRSDRKEVRRTTYRHNPAEDGP